MKKLAMILVAISLSGCVSDGFEQHDYYNRSPIPLGCIDPEYYDDLLYYQDLMIVEMHDTYDVVRGWDGWNYEAHENDGCVLIVMH